MTDYVTKADLTEALSAGFDDIYIKLTNHFDEHFDVIEKDIAKLNKKYDHLIAILDTF